MARNESAPEIVPPAVEAAVSGDSRSITLSVPLSDGTTKQMKRTDYIRMRWSAGVDRGTIRKEVEALQGEKVTYQVVFAATKNQPGGPEKPAKASTEEGAAVE